MLPLDSSLVGWELLPEELLVSIFGYLEIRDLVRASSVCRQWCRVFHEPLLWRIRRIRVSNNQEDLTEDLEALNKLTNVLSVHVRDIQVICKQLTGSVGESEPLRCRFLVKLLETLTLNSSLESIFIYQLLGDNFQSLRYDDANKSVVIETLSTFLECQTSLNYVDFSRGFLSRTYSARLMQSLTKSKSLECLTLLAIGCMFSPLLSVAEIRNQLRDLFASCKKLKQIHLNYSYLRAAGVETVCKMLKKSLRSLIIEIKYPVDELDDPHEAIISTQEWEEACRHCPQLKVAFELPRWRTDIRFYLVKGIPLWKVEGNLNYLPRYPEEVGDTVTMLLYHVSKYFNGTIELLTVSTRTNNPVCPPSKEALSNFISKCQKIKKITFSPQLMTPVLIQQVRSEVGDELKGLPNDVITIS